jgi:hypothetical protein
LVQVVPPPLSGLGIGVEASGREHPLPGPLTAGRGQRASQRVG